MIMYFMDSYSENNVYHLQEGEEVDCAHCISAKIYPYRVYTRGQAFLAGPNHTPWDGNANYICRDHLDEDATIVE